MIKRLTALCLCVIFITLLPAHAQEESRTVVLRQEETTIQLQAPADWIDSADIEAGSVGVQSAAYGTEVGRVILSLRPLEAQFGDLPANDQVGTFLELLAASLPYTRAWQPAYFSEIRRFRWDGHEAAVFVGYTPPADGLGDYARWLGLKIGEDHILIIEQSTTLSTAEPPQQSRLDMFNLMLASLQINGESLDAAGAVLALAHLSDPVVLAGPVVAALRLGNVLEVRLAAPQDWQRRDATLRADYPTTYFFEDDLRELAEGENPSGAFIQVSLLDQPKLRRLLDAEDLPPPRDLALAYLNALLPNASPNAQYGEPLDFEWGAYYAVLIPVRYTASGMLQHLLVVEIENRLLMATCYAPPTRWEAVFPIWRNVLNSLTINGETPPTETLNAGLGQAVFPQE